jgi:hypothetical protein
MMGYNIAYGLHEKGIAVMSIMPEGGWRVREERENNEPSPESKEGGQPVHSTYSEGRPWNGGLICKVCDSGRLKFRSLFRMSGPAVVIGFILLIPSICGMVFSVLVLIGVIVTASVPLSSPTIQSTNEASFRQGCAESFKHD